jgi:hypothetical protein
MVNYSVVQYLLFRFRWLAIDDLWGVEVVPGHSKTSVGAAELRSFGETR